MPPSLDPFFDPLPVPPVVQPVFIAEDGTRHYRLVMRNGERKVHGQLPGRATFWGYEGMYPGPTIEVPVESPVVVEFVNDLRTAEDSHWPFAIPASDDGMMAPAVPPAPWTVVHLHGSPNPPDSDGCPDNAYLPGGSQTHHYPRQESAALLWYHDHANMITRLNVYAGLAGLYLVRDRSVEVDQLHLPVGPPFEIPLVLQDRDLEVVGDQFTGRFAYQVLSENAAFRPPFRLVNGVITPFVKVEPRVYRLRILNGSNARFYRLKLMRHSDEELLGTGDMIQIGVDGGFLPRPVKGPTTLTTDGEEEVLVLGPAERADVLIDLSQYAGGKVVLVDHNAISDDRANLLLFDVGAPPLAALGVPPPLSSISLAPHRSPRLAPASPPAEERTRYIALFKVGDMQTINGRLFHDAVEETPELDTTEIWEIINVSGEQHPIHIHLVNFEVMERQEIASDDGTDPDAFGVAFRKWLAQDPSTRGPLPQGWKLVGQPIPADDNEVSPKDTVRAPDSFVTRIRIRFRLRTGVYMYHCHILEHEDMEMMRPLIVMPAGMQPMTMPAHNHHHGHG
jgi:spore coat protein A, manganese oxidase